MITILSVVIIEKEADFKRKAVLSDLVIKKIEIQVRDIADHQLIVLDCLGNDDIRYYIHMHYSSFWRFKKMLTRNIIYKLLNNKTSKDLRGVISSILKDDDSMGPWLYKIIRRQAINL